VRFWRTITIKKPSRTITIEGWRAASMLGAVAGSVVYTLGHLVIFMVSLASKMVSR
jgi:hypothetical protein